MTRQILVDDLLRILPWILTGLVFASWGSLMLWIGYSRGWRRGIRDRPDVQKEEMAQARFNLGVIEDRLDTERKLTKRLEVVVSSLAANQHEESRQRVAR